MLVSLRGANEHKIAKINVAKTESRCVEYIDPSLMALSRPLDASIDQQPVSVRTAGKRWTLSATTKALRLSTYRA